MNTPDLRDKVERMVRPAAPDAPSPDRRITPEIEPPHLHPPYRSTATRVPSRHAPRIPRGPTEIAPLAVAALLGNARGDESQGDGENVFFDV